MMSVDFKPAEERYVRYRAKLMKMTVSDYLRYAAIYEGVMGVDVEAIKLMRSRTLARVRAKFGDVVQAIQPEAEGA